MNTDFFSHRIEGWVNTLGKGAQHLKVPLISNIAKGLWMGGCIHDAVLPDYIQHVVSLYPWEKYKLPEGTERTEFKMYDEGKLPNLDTVHLAANLVNTLREEGKTVLVHCQAGLNRSGLITGVSLIKRGYEPVNAIKLLREKRSPLVLCNHTFENYLMGYHNDS